MLRTALWALCGLCLSAGLACGKTIYVDNVVGRDVNDGVYDVSHGPFSGPVKSLRRALELVQNGDTIELANTGTPYYESISLVGTRLGGVESIPLTIQGNGATLSGLRRLPPQGWQQVGENLWQVSFNRKGYYRLLRDGLVVPEHRQDDSSRLLETLPAGHWCAHQGRVYFRPDGSLDPAQERFDFAADEVGITLYQVEHVRIVDLAVEHFRLDGINAQNMCRGILLENVASRENGRAGLAVGGTSAVHLRDSRFERNGRHSLLVTGKGSVNSTGSEFDQEPDLRP